ncbi:MAG: 3-deoxy-8-phosphooctulonate synthase [Chlorobiales bacterium]|nr:3-deoxy-8-phosphooctulonate synthase [Chlorobiales bacterium]
MQKKQTFSIGNITVPAEKELFFIAGPCLIEGREMAFEVASVLSNVREEQGVPIIFKGSFRKANRSSASSFTGIGNREALEILGEIRGRFDMPVLTDVHEAHEVEIAAQYVDVLQIPAFLCRQSDLLTAAGDSGLCVNIKKGQFMAPEDMAMAAEKVALTGNMRVMLTERGTMFGYHNLVVDFRGISKMQSIGFPVVYDATHSLQLPSAGQGVSGGEREHLHPMTRAAVAAGVDGLFFEVHPDPEKALSDASTQLPLRDFPSVVRQMQKLHTCVSNLS